jgi:hypothetical protein
MSYEPRHPERYDGKSFERFLKMARVLFRVDKWDIPKHAPTRLAKHSDY